MASAGRRRSSAAVAYAPPQGYAPSQNPNYDPGSAAYDDYAQPNSVPYGPPDPAVNAQPQHPGARRSSSHQPPPTAPMSVLRHPGFQSSSSYGPSGSAAYGTSPSYIQAPPPQQYGTSPNGGGYYASSPTSQAPPVQGYPDTQPSSRGGPPPRPSYSNGYDHDSAVDFDESADYRPSQRERKYSHTSPDRRRLSAQDAHDRHSDAYRVPPGYGERQRERRLSHTRSDRDAYEGHSDYSDGYEAGYEAAERRERRHSKASTHSRDSKSSKHKHGSSSSKDDSRTYGNSLDWAWHGMRKFLGSSRE